MENKNTSPEILEFLKKTGLNIPILSSEKHYWVVRARSLAYRQTKHFSDNDEIWVTKDEIFTYSPNQYKTKFNEINEISLGDILLIPNYNLKKIKIVESISDIKKEENVKEYKSKVANNEAYIQRINFKLLKEISISELDIKIASEFDLKTYSKVHKNYGIVNIDAYSSDIEELIYDFYIKENEIKYSIKLLSSNELKLGELRTLVNLPYIIDSYLKNNYYDLDESICRIYFKSPGNFSIKSKGLKGLKDAVITIFLLDLILNGISISYKDFEIETEGIGDFIIKNKKELFSNVDEEKIYKIDHNDPKIDEIIQLDKNCSIKLPNIKDF
ncbi:Uncharacterised protein [Mycobacteroides abscessus subsp. abscessus]|mgnify:CR=1 FL=1|uniref:hypothetical protein n=1 Tax=Staphylococcus hominis TaxID=1290 RepID=UPI00035E34DA|nr:Uncharacterised protein [Mycobacteroides abscessus subsp. abscessus]